MMDLVRWLATAFLIFLPTIGIALLSGDAPTERSQPEKNAIEVAKSDADDFAFRKFEPSPADFLSPGTGQSSVITPSLNGVKPLNSGRAPPREAMRARGERMEDVKKAVEHYSLDSFTDYKSVADEASRRSSDKRAHRITPHGSPQPTSGKVKIADDKSDRRTPADRASLVDSVRETLRNANVAFNAPDHGKVGKTFVVEAKVSQVLTSELLGKEITEPGKVETAPLRVSRLLIATLSGGEAFDVSPSGRQSKFVSESGITTWTWQVTPKSAGEARLLILTFDAVIKVDDQTDNLTINTFKRSLHVDVDWPENAGQWLDWVKKNGENIHWIWVTVVLPTVMAFLAWLTGKRSRAARDGDK